MTRPHPFGLGATSGKVAQRIAELCAEVVDSPGSASVTESCAGVGATTAALIAAGFSSVSTVELDVSRFRMLVHNLSLVTGHAPGPGTMPGTGAQEVTLGPVRAFCGDFVQLAPALCPPQHRGAHVVVLDPPWREEGAAGYQLGGVELGGIPVVQLIKQLEVEWVVCKLMITFDVAALNTEVKAVGGSVHSVVKMQGHTQLVVVYLGTHEALVQR